MSIPRIVGTEFGGADTARLLLLGPSLGTSAATLWSAAAAHTTELLAGLQIDATRATANLAAAGDGVLAEQQTMAALTGHAPAAEYLGAAEQLVDSALQRASHYLKDVP